MPADGAGGVKAQGRCRSRTVEAVLFSRLSGATEAAQSAWKYMTQKVAATIMRLRGKLLSFALKGGMYPWRTLCQPGK